MKLFMLFVVMMITNSIIEKLIRAKCNIHFPRRPFTYVNNTHQWLEFVSFAIAIVSLVLVFVLDKLLFLYSLIASTYFVFMLRVFVEYKYEREEREYIISLVNLVSFTVFIGILLVYQHVFY